MAGTGLADLKDGVVQASLVASADPSAIALAGDAATPGRLRAAAGIEAALASCDVPGGTAPARVSAALAAARRRLDG